MLFERLALSLVLSYAGLAAVMRHNRFLEKLMRSYLVAVSLLMAATPALASEFYVGKNPTTGDCDIFDVKPDGTNLLMIGTAYPTRQAAKDARRQAPECEKNK
jgi:hypothetical protein